MPHRRGGHNKGHAQHMTIEDVAFQNGQDKRFKLVLGELVGKIRFGWSVAAVLLSSVFLIATLFVNGGWLTVPAKESDMKDVKVKVESMIIDLKAVGLNVARMDEENRAQGRQIELIDRKLDRIIDLNFMARLAPATTPPPPPFTGTNGRKSKDEELLKAR